jgi:Protein of unknown function (DUF3455)
MMGSFAEVGRCISPVFAALLVAGCASAPPVAPPSVPAAIEAPATLKPALRWFGRGTQNYTCTVKPDGAGAEWKLTAPEATLYAGAEQGAAEVGKHGAGPSWIASDGSHVIGDGAAAKKAPSPDASSVAWLLVPKKEGDATGTLGGVEYVQRVDTVGGQPPATGCDTATVGATVKVPYSATYVFYRAA